MSTHKMISGAIPSNGSSIVELSAANMDETYPGSDNGVRRTFSRSY